MTSHVVQFSGGMGSYATARRVKEYEGKDELYLLFADTLIEDDDLYRFVIETAADLQDVPRRKITVLTDECKYIPAYEEGNMEARKGYLFNLAERARKIIPGLIWIAEGRDVWETMFDSRYLGNSRIDPCSKNLKRDFLRKYLDANFVPEDTLIYLGIDFTEKHRFDKAKDRWLPFECKAPLCEPPFFDREETKQYLFKRGIKQPRLYDLGMEHNNCFHPDTRYVTDKGLKTFRETLGETVRVRNGKGQWAEAEIKTFGSQALWNLHLRRYNEDKVVQVTENHQWYVRKGRDKQKAKTTKNLVVGDKIPSVLGKLGSGVRPSPFGIAHGIVFGDGTHPVYLDGRNWNPPANVTLCGEKDRELLPYFPLSHITTVKDVGVKVNDLPHYFKIKPSLTESNSYLYGWLAGYFAADGSVSGGIPEIHSSSVGNLEFVRDVALKLGIGANSIKSEERMGIDGKMSTLYHLSFIPYTLEREFFLIPAHLQNFNPERKRKRASDWTVTAISPAEISHEVMCAVVPGDHRFVLEGNILTGNCGGFCIKAGQKHFKRLLENMPEKFEYHANKEQEMREYLDKDVSILRKQIGGERINYTLFDLKADIEKDKTIDEMDEAGCGCVA